MNLFMGAQVRFLKRGEGTLVLDVEALRLLGASGASAGTTSTTASSTPSAASVPSVTTPSATTALSSVAASFAFFSSRVVLGLDNEKHKNDIG